MQFYTKNYKCFAQSICTPKPGISALWGRWQHVFHRAFLLIPPLCLSFISVIWMFFTFNRLLVCFVGRVRGGARIDGL